MDVKICRKCNRVLQKTVFDKCLFCGARMPASQCLTDEQKIELVKKQNEEQAKHKNEKSSFLRGGDDSMSAIGIVIGSDSAGGSSSDCG